MLINMLISFFNIHIVIQTHQFRSDHIDATEYNHNCLTACFHIFTPKCCPASYSPRPPFIFIFPAEETNLCLLKFLPGEYGFAYVMETNRTTDYEERYYFLMVTKL